MRVKDLIKKLQKIDGEREVILANDSEGNTYYKLMSIDENAVFVPVRYGEGDVFIEKLDQHLIELGYSDEDLYDGNDSKPAIVLYP